MSIFVAEGRGLRGSAGLLYSALTMPRLIRPSPEIAPPEEGKQGTSAATETLSPLSLFLK